MKTNNLVLDFSLDAKYPNVKYKGLSFKAIRGSFADKYLVRSDLGYQAFTFCSVSSAFHVDNYTCQLKVTFMAEIVNSLHQCLGFDKVVVKGYYQLTSEQLTVLAKV